MCLFAQDGATGKKTTAKNKIVIKDKESKKITSDDKQAEYKALKANEAKQKTQMQNKKSNNSLSESDIK